MKPSFTIKKSENTGLVSLRLPYKGGVFQVSTGIKVKLEEWESGIVTNPLRDTLEHFKNFYKSTNVKDKSVVVTEWDKFNNGSSKMLSSFIDNAIENKNNSGVYQNCKKLILSYGDIEVYRINMEWYKGFSDYLMDHPEKYSSAYIAKMVSTLKTILKMAYKDGLLKSISFLEDNVSIKAKNSENIHLTSEEVKRLRAIELEGRLDFVRNIFVVLCLTGIKYSELSNITRDMIKSGKNKYGKTFYVINSDKDVTIPIIYDDVIDLFDKIFVKRFISPQKFNEYIKEVALLAGFTDEVSITEFRGNDSVVKVYEKWQLFNSELAKRSFLVNCYLDRLRWHSSF